MDVWLFRLTLGPALQVCCSVVQSFLSNCCQNCAAKPSSVQCILNNLLSTVAFSKAILLHENCMCHSVSILSRTHTYLFLLKRILQSHCQFLGLALFQLRRFLHLTAAPGLSIWLPCVKLDKKVSMIRKYTITHCRPNEGTARKTELT